MEIVYRIGLIGLLSLILGACSDNSEPQQGETQGSNTPNRIVTDKTMQAKQTIQDAKNMDAFLQKSVEQKSSELDKY